MLGRTYEGYGHKSTNQETLSHKAVLMELQTSKARERASWANRPHAIKEINFY